VGSALNSEDGQKGYNLAVRVCGVCHLLAPDQPTQRLLAPPAPAFASIVRQRTFDEDPAEHFLTTTHRGLDNPKGMPNPELVDYQIKEIVAYFLEPLQIKRVRAWLSWLGSVRLALNVIVKRRNFLPATRLPPQ